ncbi:MAG: chloride channel protein [Gemmatimonadota bacterium]|nr:chloride channel protein [Gemmatimonadota bacterium]
MRALVDRVRSHPLVRRYSALVREDMAATYARDLHRWILIAPVLGVITGLLITGIAEIILQWLWPAMLRVDLAHPAAIVPTVTLGFVAAGLIMQYMTPDPDEHSTEEIIRAYHEHHGAVSMRPFVPKLLAAIATVGLGGSAALEGPSIYGGGAVGSWLWTRLRGFGLTRRDRRILLISGAAAGMSAVFRAPLTGIIFALEMPYKDDLAHEALLPSLIASVVSYATMAAFMGSQPLFDFPAAAGYTRRDLLWAVVLGAGCGLLVMTFTITFRRFRQYSVRSSLPHWVKMAIGGLLTGLCGVAFLWWYHGTLVPIGPNYEAVNQILRTAHSSGELVVFSVLKLAATLFSLGVGGVSAMFVPLFLTGGSLGTAFAQSVVHAASPGLFAAVGMAAFIAAGYKTPLTAVIFVAEATGGHAFIIPALIGAAVAYGVSGEASASGDQRLHEAVRVAELANVPVEDAMQPRVATVAASATLLDFSRLVDPNHAHAAYPVLDGERLTGVIAVGTLSAVSPAEWGRHHVRDFTEHDAPRIPPEADLQEALRLLLARPGRHLLLVTSAGGALEGVLTTTDILAALDAAGQRGPAVAVPAEAATP